MKKVILSVAALALAIGAQAQGTFTVPATGMSSENDITANISMVLPDWIDLDDDANTVTSVTPTTWAQLNNGWEFPSFTMTLSSSRAATVRAMGDQVRHSSQGTYPSTSTGYYFSATELSLGVTQGTDWAQTVTPSNWNASAHQYGIAALPQRTGSTTNFSGSGAVPALTTNHGVYGKRFNWSVQAFKTGNVSNNGATLATGRSAGNYYNYNLVGGTYSTVARFEATLNPFTP